MKYITRFIFLIFLITACNKKEVVDTSKIDNLLSITDSLYNEVTNFYTKNLDILYTITEDSLLADSISGSIELPDSIGFYEFLSLSIEEINEVYYQTQREIDFTQDQLINTKRELIENKINDSSYIQSLKNEKEVINLLHERIDSSKYFIERKREFIFKRDNSYNE